MLVWTREQLAPSSKGPDRIHVCGRRNGGQPLIVRDQRFLGSGQKEATKRRQGLLLLAWAIDGLNVTQKWPADDRLRGEGLGQMGGLRASAGPDGAA